MSPFSMSEFFKREFPQYLAMGMTYELYWHGDASLPRDYLKAALLKQKLQNEQAWRQGMYIYDAILCASPAIRAFSKHPEPLPYLNEPYPLTVKDAEEMERRKQKKQMEAEIEKMRMRAEAWNKQLKGDSNAR